VSRWRTVVARLRAIGRGRQQDGDLRDEIASHLDEAIDDYQRQGHSAAEARRLARQRFGGIAQISEAHREGRSFAWFDSTRRDLRYAVRALRRTPAFTAAATATLAIVIGANSAVFSLADAILWRPLPYPQPEQLAQVVWAGPAANGPLAGTALDGRTWSALRTATSAVDTAVTAGEPGQPVNFNADHMAAFVTQARVGAGYFRVLGISPVFGREFTDDEDRPGGPAVAVLGHDIWTRMFDEDPSAVGRTILLRGESFRVVGVLPAGFINLGSAAEVFTPVRPSTSGEGGGANYTVIARLHPGRTWAEANGELATVGRTVHAGDAARGPASRRLTARPLQVVRTEDLRTPLHLLLGAALMMLLVACVNLAALLLARGGSRGRELATRLALGCSRAVLVRQLIVESLVLGLGGGLIGLAIGGACLAALKTGAAGNLVTGTLVHMDTRVTIVTLAGALMAALVFGVVPAVMSSRLDVNGALPDHGSRVATGGAPRSMRRLLVGAEVALSVVLLVTAGLFVRTVSSLAGLDPGFDPDRLSATNVSLQDARYGSADAVNRLFDESLSRLERTPGVESAAVSLELPYSRLLNDVLQFADRPPSQRPLLANFMYVTPRFFETLRIPIRAGRVFTADDTRGRPGAVVVNDAFVRYLADGRSPVGRSLRVDGDQWRIVGVVGDVQTRSSGLAIAGMRRGPLETPPLVFLPAAQVSDGFVRLVHQWFAPYWTVRTAAGVEADAVLRQAIAYADPRLPVARTVAVADVQAAATSFQRLLAALVSAFAGAALLLAGIGIYGLIAQTVLDRTREFGIRLALGATFGRAVRQLIWSGVTVAIAGTVIGSGLAWAITQFLVSLLWGVSAHDPLTFAAIASLVCAVALAASAVPALRVLRLDPGRTLRS
jgi:putative ABC transport system permease protein